VLKRDSSKIWREHDIPIAVMVKVAFPGKKLVEQETLFDVPGNGYRKQGTRNK
jgi:hypothetical protein